MKKPITLWTFVLSVLFVAVSTGANAQQNASSLDVNQHQQQLVEENSRLPEHLMLQNMSDEDRLEYLLQRDFNHPPLSVDKKRIIKMELEGNSMNNVTPSPGSPAGGTGPHVISAQEYLIMKAARKAHIDQNPQLYIIQ